MQRTAFAFAVLLGCLFESSGISAHPSDAEKIDILTRLIEAEPEAPRHYIARGAAYAHDQRYELALADLRKAEQLGDPVLVAYELAVLHEHKGDLPAARAYAAAYLERFPGSPPALELYARTLAALGETGKAIAAFEKLLAVQIRPNPGSYISLARLVAAASGSGIDASLTVLDRGMARLGVIPQLQQAAIELELQRGQQARALERLESLEPLLGEGPEWKVDKGELLMRLGRSAEARPLLAAASSQLARLRNTPARRALAARIVRLEETQPAFVEE